MLWVSPLNTIYVFTDTYIDVERLTTMTLLRDTNWDFVSARNLLQFTFTGISLPVTATYFFRI